MDKIKTAIIGMGRAGGAMHCKELDDRKDKYVITAVCDIDLERCQPYVEKYGCEAYTNIAELVESNDADLISIATRSMDHVEHSETALSAGKDVFLEKPIGLNLKDATRLKEAAEQSTGNLYLRHNRRFEPAFQHINEIIASGILGSIFEIKLRRLNYQRRDDWQTLIKHGGGQLNNWGPHIIDHALQFLGSPVKDIWSDLKCVAALGDAEDHLKIVLRGENKRIVDLEISGGAAISEPVYLVFGDKGALSSDEKTITLRHLDPEQEFECQSAHEESPPINGGYGSAEELRWIEKTIDVAPSKSSGTDKIWDHLYSAIRENTPFPIKMEEGLEVVRVIDEVKSGTEFA